MSLLTTDKKSLAAKAIFGAVDVLLNKNATDEQVLQTTKLLKTAFSTVMPFLRGDECAFSDTADELLKIYNSINGSPSEAFITAVCNFTDIKKEEALYHVLPALCYAMARTFTQNHIEELDDTAENEYNEELAEANNKLFAILDRAAMVVCGPKSIKKLKGQLVFIGENLGVTAPEFKGDDACIKLCEALEETYDFEKEILKDAVYGIFHRKRVSKLRTYIEHHPKSQFADLITNDYADLSDDDFVENPFYAKKRDRAIFVKGLQKYTLETLILTKKFLEENNLRFYLTEGTLLGAVRHNGFIPWDDDVDIAMPRDDYNRLVELAKEGKIPKELNFDALENNPNHWVLGAKMQLVKKTPYIQHKVTKLSKCNGPYVDIFPLDYWDRPAGLKFSIAAMWVKICRRLLFINTGYSVRAKKRSYFIVARFITFFLKNTWIEKLAIKNMTKFLNGNRKYMVNLCSYYPYYKEVFPAGFFGEPKYINFEGELMPIPSEYDCMLKTVYSKYYDSIPPVRVTNMRKHAFELDTENN